MVRCDVRLGWAGDLGKRRKKIEKVVELSKLRYHELKVDFFFIFRMSSAPGRRNGIIDNRETLMKPKIK